MCIRVLIWDDDPVSVRRLKEQLDAIASFEVTLVDDPIVAMEFVAKQHPDLAIVDIKGDNVGRSPAQVAAYLQALCERRGHDLDSVIPVRVLAQSGFDHWVMSKDYGIGLLALLLLEGCAYRMAFTRFGGDAKLVDALTFGPAGHLVSYGVVDKKDVGGLIERVKWAAKEIEIHRRLEEGRRAPDRYLVHVLEDLDDRSTDQPLKRLRLRVLDTHKNVDAEIVLAGDHAIIFQTIADNGGEPISSRELMNRLNARRRGTSEFVPYTELEILRFAERFGIASLCSATQSGKGCALGNDYLCGWQRLGGQPSRGEEGYECFEATRCLGQADALGAESQDGYCPKLQMRRSIPDPDDGHLKDPASIRGKISELRHRFLQPFSEHLDPSFHTPRGIITKVGRDGYALAGTITYL